MQAGKRRRKLGIVLGSGSARGWAHIGVLRALSELGIEPDLICGSSIGALVGAARAANELDRLEDWVRTLSVGDMLRLLDLRLGTGLIKGERLTNYLRENFSQHRVENLELPFAAVATALGSGMEVWLRSGSTVDAVRASIALPGIFTPVLHEDDWLVDGGLVNPVPVSLARAMGAEVVIAVDLNTDMLGRHLQKPAAEPAAAESGGGFRQRWQERWSGFWPGREADNTLQAHPEATIDEPEQAAMPSMFSVLSSSLNIMQVRISRSRMAGDPADVLIAPRLARLSLFDFQRGEEAIAEGRRAVTAALPQLEALGLLAT
ncbi:MAG: patatin-like phospholipase RssA [Sterolibacterium sp.]|nr:patatin-like phospholipase RssA [Sterolibacterium sp.]